MMAGGYAAPRTLDEALTLLSKNPGARVLAGGHGLLVEPGRSTITDALLVDLRHLDALRGIALKKGELTIGAMTTLATIVDSKDVQKACPVLAEAARLAGDGQMRNRATLGGSLAGANAEADLPAVALALDVRLQLTGPKGAREVSADELFPGGKTGALGKGELLTSITIPAAADRSGAAYANIRHAATRQALCGIAVQLTVAKDGTVTAIRAASTGATEYQARLQGVEKALLKQKADKASVTAAAAAAAKGLTCRADLFASAEYRSHLAGVLAERALTQALAAAGVSVS